MSQLYQKNANNIKNLQNRQKTCKHRPEHPTITTHHDVTVNQSQCNMPPPITARHVTHHQYKQQPRNSNTHSLRSTKALGTQLHTQQDTNPQTGNTP